MDADLRSVVIDEVADLVRRDATELGPFPKGADRRLLASGEYPALAQANDVRELGVDDG